MQKYTGQIKAQKQQQETLSAYSSLKKEIKKNAVKINKVKAREEEQKSLSQQN